MIGGGFDNPTEIRDKFLYSWNDLFVKEAPKYDLKKVFLKVSVLYNLGIVNERNNKVDDKKLVTLNSTDTINVNESMIKTALSGYNTGNDKGIGLVFFVKSFNKYTQTATITVVFFDIATKTILFTKSETGLAAGVGLRNYWAGAIFKILEKCKKDFATWKNEFCK